MTHLLKIDSQGDYITTKWFVRSIHAIYEYSLDASRLRQRYEDEYSVRIRFNDEHMINGVEFPTKEQAMEFMLRWA